MYAVGRIEGLRPNYTERPISIYVFFDVFKKELFKGVTTPHIYYRILIKD